MLTIEKLAEYGADVKAGLNLCMNSEDFYLRMVSMIVAEQSFADLKKAIEENDLDAAFQAAHALKGVTGNLSLTPLYNKVAEITELLRAKTQMDYSELLKAILSEKEKLEKEFTGVVLTPSQSSVATQASDRKAQILLDEEGKLERIRPALLADAIATSAGAVLGTSTTTTFVESSAGVAEGGKTGLTAVTTGLLFLASIILAPVFTAIPGFATAPALIYVGFLMVTTVVEIDFNDLTESIEFDGIILSDG